MTFLRKVAITVAITFLGKSSGSSSDYKKKCSELNSGSVKSKNHEKLLWAEQFLVTSPMCMARQGRFVNSIVTFARLIFCSNELSSHRN